jgi:phage I-like protein
MTMTSNAVSQDQTPTLPEWIRVLPLGTVELSDHREPFTVDEASLMSMTADFRSRGVDLVIDYEHQSLQGERAPAAGWIKDLEARPDGLWARVDWTQ